MRYGIILACRRDITVRIPYACIRRRLARVLHACRQVKVTGPEALPALVCIMTWSELRARASRDPHYLFCFSFSISFLYLFLFSQIHTLVSFVVNFRWQKRLKNDSRLYREFSSFIVGVAAPNKNKNLLQEIIIERANNFISFKKIIYLCFLLLIIIKIV